MVASAPSPSLEWEPPLHRWAARPTTASVRRPSTRVPRLLVDAVLALALAGVLRPSGTSADVALVATWVVLLASARRPSPLGATTGTGLVQPVLRAGIGLACLGLVLAAYLKLIGRQLLVVLIALLGIYFTHKVVGPIYKMKMLLRQVGDGKLNFQGKLRKGDELQDFFEVFAAMVEKLKARQTSEVEELEAAMKEAQATGASDAAIAKIAKVRDEMRAALEK